MPEKKEAARHSGNCDTRQNVHSRGDVDIVHDFERGTMIAGILTAVSFGLMLVHAAVL